MEPMRRLPTWQKKDTVSGYGGVTGMIYGLLLKNRLFSVADWAGIDVPVAQGLLSLALAILGRDLRLGVRTLEGMGLGGLTVGQMRKLLTEGVLV